MRLQQFVFFAKPLNHRRIDQMHHHKEGDDTEGYTRGQVAQDSEDAVFHRGEHTLVIERVRVEQVVCFTTFKKLHL